jgi:flagellar brake protein
MELQSDFLISSPEKIISKLSVLHKNKSLLTVGYGSNTFVTTILEVNKKDQVFICDGCNEEILENILGCTKIYFKTEHLGAMVAFDAAKLVKTEYGGNLAFSVPIPLSLRWMEQREFFRVRVPSSASSCCQMKFPDQEAPVTFKVYDISIRGFSMLNNSDEISELLIPGKQYDRCKLILDGIQEMVISFEVRSKIMLNPNNLNKVEKIGCKFSRITNTFENTVHGYMMEIERDLLKKRTENTSYIKF